MKKCLMLMILCLCFAPWPAHCQMDIFQVRVPNVMIIFDTSGSMEMSLNLYPDGSNKWTNQKGPDGVHYYRQDGNHPDSKLYSAKSSLTNVINNVLKDKEVNLGFATYAQMKVDRVRGKYSRSDGAIDEAWKRRKRYYLWYTTNDTSPRYANSLTDSSFTDAWGVIHNSVVADSTAGTTFSRSIKIYDTSGPLHPTSATKDYTITYRVTARTLNAETNVYTFKYEVITAAYDWYSERYFYDLDGTWQTSVPDCGEDKKNNPWPATKPYSGPIKYQTHFSDDPDAATNYKDPWKCQNCSTVATGSGDASCHRTAVNAKDSYYWDYTDGTVCDSTKTGGWTLLPGTCYDWSYYKYTPEPANTNNRPHTWSYYKIQGGNWKSAQQPSPYYPASSGAPGSQNNHWFFLNFPDDKDSGFNPSQRQTHYNTIKSFADLTPVLNPETGEYWTKLPIQPSITASTSAVDTTKQTPLANALDAAYRYFYDYIYEYQCNGCPEKGDSWSQQIYGQTRCRGNYIILLTDGLESARFNGSNPDYTAAPAVAASLYQKYIQTFVIGFGQDVLQSAGYTALNNIANAGSPPPPNQRNAYFPTNQTQLEQALKEIFQAILSDSFGRSNPVMVKSGNRIFRGYFDITSAGDWKGNLEAREVNGQGEITNPFPAAPTWSAGDSLKDNENRKIYTWTGNSPNRARIDFKTDSSSLYSFVNPLGEDINGDSAVDNNDAVTVINFTLDPGYSGGKYRGKRPVDWKLGDVYHGSPVVVGAPPAFFAENNYPAFAMTWKNRESMIYAGTNDGMLHGFKVSDGSEVFAVVPKNLLGKLKNLSSTHDFYVDGSPKAADFYSTADSQWKTVIIAGERGGGPYYFAIDVTDPLNADYPKILWEWTDLKMGDAWAKPEVGKIKDGANTKYVAFVTGGYSTSNNVSNSFYVIDIDTGTTLKKWTNLGGPDNKIPGGATAFSLSAENYTSYVYFGDNEGNLWKVDVSAPDTNNWTCAVLFSPPSAKRKPIFYAPAIVKNDAGKILVFFGSGDDFNILTPSTSYFWEVWDNNGTGTTLGSNWPMQLDNQKVLSTPVPANNVVYFATWDYSGGGENCGAGEGFLYGVSTSTSKATGGAGALVLLDAQGNPQSAVGSTSLGPGIPSKPLVTNGIIYTTSSVGARVITPRKFKGWATSNVKSWREIF